MYHHGNAQTRIGRRKQIVLAMGIALGLATQHSHWLARLVPQFHSVTTTARLPP